MIFDYDRWEKQLPTLAEKYRTASPYPSIVVDGFLDPDFARQVAASYPPPDSDYWTHYNHVNEKKLAQTNRAKIPPIPLEAINELNSPRFIAFLSKLTGIPNLIPDPSLAGGGMHQIKKGGFLNVHADFTSHPFEKNWARRVNVLVYFNEGWQDSYGGHLELWDRKAKNCEKQILPIFNRAVVFSTDPDAFHGHPHPLTCPETTARKSIALYYFTVEKSKPLSRSTEYKPDPNDPALKKAMVFADKWVLRVFDKVKRTFGISDETIGKILKKLSK